MFEIPGTAIRKVNITEEVVMGVKKPEYSEHASARSAGSGSGKGDKYNDEEQQHESDNGKERAVNP